jgi:putative transcriptional regulator
MPSAWFAYTVSVANSPAPDTIREARKSAGLTQTAAAELAHSTMRTWQDWEAGKAHMHPGLWELFILKSSAKAP